MKKSLFNYFQRELPSLAMGSTLWVTTRRLGVKLSNRNSRYVSHREIEFFEGDDQDPLLTDNDGVYRLIGRSTIYVSFEHLREGFEPFPGNLLEGALSEAIAYLNDGTLPYVRALVWLHAEMQTPVAYGVKDGSGTVRPFFEADQLGWEELTIEQIEARECVTRFHWAKGQPDELIRQAQAAVLARAQELEQAIKKAESE